jgi:hypothetical protein
MHTDQRRAILINLNAYKRQRAAESDHSLLQTICGAVSLALFVTGGLMMIVALTA